MSDDSPAIDKVYRDRNLLACAFVASVTDRVDTVGGWTPADDPDDDADPDEWAIVWATPPSGQVSWHVPREMADSLLDRDDNYEYDGHTDDQKRDSLRDFVRLASGP